MTSQARCEQTQAGGLAGTDVAIENAQLRELKIQGERATAQTVAQQTRDLTLTQRMSVKFAKRERVEDRPPGLGLSAPRGVVL